MPGNLPRLKPDDSDPVEVQDTSFTRDTLGRYVCNTLAEATTNPDFDVVVIGAGTYGAHVAQYIFQGTPHLRVLVLEAGSLLVPGHLQTLPRLDLFSRPAPQTAAAPGVAHNLVWRHTYGCNVENIGVPMCVGGRSLYWGGWAVRLSPEDLQDWPEAVRADLLGGAPQAGGSSAGAYERMERLTGRAGRAAFLEGPFAQAIRTRVDAAVRQTRLGPVENAPVATVGDDSPGGSDLFAFNKFSSAGLLMRAVRQAVREAYPDGERRLFLVPGVRVLQLLRDGSDPSRVGALQLSVNGGEPQQLELGQNCRAVLAPGTVESTRLALASFPAGVSQASEKMGRNLMTHQRSCTILRLPRAALAGDEADVPPAGLHAAALLVRGRHKGHGYCLEITAVDELDSTADGALYHQIPDLDLYQRLLAARRPGCVTVVIRGCCEMASHRDAIDRGPGTSWMDRSPFERDEFNRPVAHVHLEAGQADLEAYQAMVSQVEALARALSGDGEVDFELKTESEPLGLASHESGTLWMGEDGASSITDTNGRFWHVDNAYCADQALFPTIGSAPPVLTGLALAERVAKAVILASRQSTVPISAPIRQQQAAV
jgi:hypothetical protein